jgi:hypothetical protein
MSKRRRSAAGAGPAPVPVRPKRNDPYVRPFKAQRGWVITLCVVFLIWGAFLVAMYFKTVYPQRHHASPPPPPAASESNSAVYFGGS